ncbi:GNAT family N-acetyltransferase [Kushneria marisflavi]|uniref:GNAT family N-acetyltransferase n=1 Tax=Kushneria marisflavi TaxID=157779 RepID=A0A240UPL6_9GAMM|nr:GNAT family protein [Kushneria marisflavi]ART63457.1 GNAT family N-acetyltransferase [Kushneria marisflavi]RKD84518.1 RimJ/RimL family protein N-acetyltransferase [Kushneria marisflavi]
MTLSSSSSPPTGALIHDWQPPPMPGHDTLKGRYCRVAPLNVATHGEALFNAWQKDDASRWVYLGGRPFHDRDSCLEWLAGRAISRDPTFLALIDRERDQAMGVAAWLNIACEHGTLELGHLNLSGQMARTRMATEALHLLIAHAFSLGYRRVEWKCDALNAPSRRAAERLGFRHEGLFRQHRVVCGRNRDTTWYALLDHEWPPVADAHRQWLMPDNFDDTGYQSVALSTLTAPLRQGE